MTPPRHAGMPRYEQVPDLEKALSKHVASGSIGLIWPAGDLTIVESLDQFLLAVGSAAARSARERPPVLPPDAWSQQAQALVAAGKLPLPSGSSRELTVNRLIRWLDPACRQIAVGLHALPADPRAFGQICDWISRAADAPCSVLLEKGPSPVYRSEPERLLHKLLEGDPELRGLFEVNVRVVTRFHNPHCVDFVWRQGKVIVEIDSYTFHATPQAFLKDRQRDYETLVTGYLTLRVLDHEVKSDGKLVVEKIRKVVAMARGKKV